MRLAIVCMAASVVMFYATTAFASWWGRQFGTYRVIYIQEPPLTFDERFYFDVCEVKCNV